MKNRQKKSLGCIKNEQMVYGQEYIKKYDEKHRLLHSTGVTVENEHEQTGKGEGHFEKDKLLRTKLYRVIHDGIELLRRPVYDVVNRGHSVKGTQNEDDGQGNEESIAVFIHESIIISLPPPTTPLPFERPFETERVRRFSPPVPAGPPFWYIFSHSPSDPYDFFGPTQLVISSHQSQSEVIRYLKYMFTSR